MRYKNESIEQMLSTINVVDVISEKVVLKKSGVGFKGLCPFHNEKTPSFIVSPTKNIYKCFGCGAGGNPLNFIMDYEKLSYIEAIEYIAERYHFDLEVEGVQNKEKINEYSILYKILDESRLFFMKQLNMARQNLNFYLEKRNLDDKSLNEFSVGYAPDSFNSLHNHLKYLNFSDEMLVSAGVVTKGKNGKLVDRFINRLMFPILDERSQTIGFGGRVFNDLDASKFGKYINSKESKVYHKSEVLYGLNMSKQAINMSKEAIVVEGYLDVIALYKAGVKNIVSASGTTFTDKQIKILKKYTNKIILCFDGDDAGEKATERMIEPVIKNEINCSVVRLPLNEDPDSFVNKLGKESFLEYIKNNEVDIIDFFVKINLKKADSEKEVLDKLLETLSPLEETTTLFFILKKISKKFEIPLSTITKSFRLFKSSNNYANTTENNNENNTVDSNLVAINDSNNISVMDVKIKDLEKEILLIFLEYPDFLDINIIYLFKNEEIKKVLNLLLEFNYTKTFINKETFLDSLASELSLKQVNYLKLSKPRFLVDLNEEMVKSILNDYLRKLDIFRNKKYIEEIKKEIINVNDFFNELDEDDINKLKKNKRNDISEITQKIKEIKNLNYL